MRIKNLPIKKYFLASFIAMFLLLAVLAANYMYISNYTEQDIEINAAAIKSFHHVLIPGAGNSPFGEWQNPSFSNRLNTLVKLYSKNKIDRIVCSGILKRPYYDEAGAMQEFLLKKKIPASLIVLDNKSASTLQSIRNYAQNYPHDSLIIISQKIHLPRAIYAAKYYGLTARGYSAGNYRGEEYKFIIYEALSRFKLRLQLLIAI